MTNTPINGAGHSGKKTVTGKVLASWLARATAITRLCIAGALAAGELEVVDPTVAQIARMLGVKSKQIRAIMQLTPEQRAALTTKRRVNNVARFSDEVVDDLVDQVGAARMLAAIDRATMPKSNGMNGSSVHTAA